MGLEEQRSRGGFKVFVWREDKGGGRSHKGGGGREEGNFYVGVDSSTSLSEVPLLV